MRKLFLFGLIGLLTFCTSNNHALNDTLNYDSVEVNTTLKEGLAFKLFDDDEGRTLINESGKEFKLRKSSDVLLIRIDDTKNKIFPINYQDCEAELINDTLKIDIGFNSLLGGSGVHISVANGKFNTQPYEYSDVIGMNNKEPRYEVEKQKMSLSKFKYSLGDSIYGHIYSRVKNDKNVKYYAIGFFRAKVAKRT